MFDQLSSRLSSAFKKLKGEGTVKEKHLDETLGELRRALLEADVHLDVVKDFRERVREKALGAEVSSSLSPGQQVIKIVSQELTDLLGGQARPLKLPQQKCGTVLLVGLQGSGKTTTAAKLAKNLKENGRIPMLVSADFSRPAAREQLAVLGEQVGVKVFQDVDDGPVEAAKAAYKLATLRGFDALIVDTAGRLHVDEALMDELKRVVKATGPSETLFVGDAMTGQDAVRSAQAFDEAVDLTGIVLTKLDGDARGGAALSMARVTGKPVRFAGLGEKPDAFELFRPDRMVSRLLGMGDVLTLIERAEKVVDADAAREMTKRARKGELTLDDFKEQLLQVRKMGSMEELVSMLPGASGFKGSLDVDERWSVHAEAIINSMTKAERKSAQLMNPSRKRRVAKGAGRPLSEVNRLLKSFKQAKKLHSKMLTAGRQGKRMPNLPFAR
ncbi:MAG: signal recognition particle protein [Acidobacteriota bacterium]